MSFFRMLNYIGATILLLIIMVVFIPVVVLGAFLPIYGAVFKDTMKFLLDRLIQFEKTFK